KKKKSVDDIIMFNKEKIIPDKLVSYDNGRGGNEGVQYSTVPDTKLKPINVEPIRRLGQKNLELYNQSRSHHEEVDKSNKDPENDALREGTALLLLAGSNERKEQIANLMANDVAKQIAIFTQINKHHRSDDIADATAL